MNEQLATRRGLVTGLGALFLCAPAIVRASSLMPINSAHLKPLYYWRVAYRVIEAVQLEANGDFRLIYDGPIGIEWTVPPRWKIIKEKNSMNTIALEQQETESCHC